MSDKVAILILAAGRPQQPDQPDALLRLRDGVDLMTLVTRRACASGFSVFVTVATDRMEHAKAIANEPVTIIPVAGGNCDMADVLRAGIRSLPAGLNGVLIMLADMPELTQQDLEVLLTHFAEVGASRVVSATDSTGNPGYPVILPARLFRKAMRLNENQSAFLLLRGENLSLVQLENGHAVTDTEKPENWISWRA